MLPLLVDYGGKGGWEGGLREEEREDEIEKTRRLGRENEKEAWTLIFNKGGQLGHLKNLGEKQPRLGFFSEKD